MKKMIALFLCLCLSAGMIQALAESSPAFTVKNTPISDGNARIGSIDLRFYADAPNIAYIGFKAYITEILHRDATVTAQEDGTWLIANKNGKTLVANPSAGTVFAEDFAGFQTPEPPYVREKTHVKDSDCAWAEVTEVVFDDAPTPVTFDFAKYGIRMYADEEDVYLPLTVVSGLMEDLSMNLMAYNGDELFYYVGNMDSLITFVPGYYEGPKIQALIKGETRRSEDQIRESYAELCFFMDHLFGFPGVAFLDPFIREKGLDASLDELPDGWGPKIREWLQSPDYVVYLMGLQALFTFGINDGHTVLGTPSVILTMADVYPESAQRIIGIIQENVIQGRDAYFSLIRPQLMKTRQEIWGDETYREYGSTAIIRIDAFNPDEEAWQAWEEGKGEMPMDALGITFRGLEKASANPAIKNVIFDLTANAGGSQDLMMSVIAMATGDVVFTGDNRLTKQKVHANVVTDRNMDRAIDEKDKDMAYEFNYGVMTSRTAFSCGNLFPILMQERGAVVIGENSGGGSCAVNMLALSDGPVFILSTYQWHLLNTKGEDVVEKGADPDLPIERIEIITSETPFPGLLPGDYTPYYNDEMLDQMMNEYFAQQEAPAA